jgi:hypothetical protein
MRPSDAPDRAGPALPRAARGYFPPALPAGTFPQLPLLSIIEKAPGKHPARFSLMLIQACRAAQGVEGTPAHADVAR